MTVPVIAEDDLPALAVAFPGLDFADADCRAVLLANGKVDVQAAPGSGKTTILAARLYLLSRKWTADRQGICVISHTNTAAQEIRHRLSATPEGTRLLAYPHFIGTIHAFINQFLALPRLRSDGGRVDVIDDEVFARKALPRALKAKAVWGWMNQRHGREDQIKSMRFSGPKLEVVGGNGFPGPDTDSGRHLRLVKQQLAREGIFRHIDMFAYAERALEVAPRLTALLARRFPLVMMDEMQDTSPAQTALLTKAFGAGAVVQRFGDINQRIFIDSEDDDDNDAGAGTTFPEDPILPMRTSRRFGPVIAGIVSKVQDKGDAVVGKGPDAAAPPTLLVYSTDTIDAVVPRFGELVLDAFDDDAINAGGHVRAICARRSSGANELPGRHVGDFWPPLAIDPDKAPPKNTNAWHLLSGDDAMGLSPVELGERVERVQRVILLALREARAPVAEDIRDPWRLFRELRETNFDTRPLRHAMRSIVIDRAAGATKVARASVTDRLFVALEPLMPGIGADDFAALSVFKDPCVDNDPAAPKALTRDCRVVVGHRAVTVTVDTVGMTKGETHLATLYLESVGAKSRRFDVVEALARQTGRKTDKGKPLKTLPAQMRHAYVGFSRPTRFLCLAINGERLDPSDLGRLIDSGWRVQSVLNGKAGDA